jgi:hypothetical protein
MDKKKKLTAKEKAKLKEDMKMLKLEKKWDKRFYLDKIPPYDAYKDINYLSLAFTKAQIRYEEKIRKEEKFLRNNKYFYTKKKPLYKTTDFYMENTLKDKTKTKNTNLK